MAAVNSSSGNSASPTTTGRNRRGSSNVLFSGLINQKRNSVDEAAQARRASFNNMTPPPGFFGRLWNK
ncbi:hypothetical protein EPUL_002053 [Erysiphe pulchra]|uniref:Conidiation-specific protein 8 n=1 Tax=Erysiphe pulchra TaxID=225359 RepID=A0A2S4PX23_9PEZI|nr:hypothetical protein EPUL_002053 [Erysiphe pulchra]